MWTRREMLSRSGTGFGLLGLTNLLHSEPVRAEPTATHPLAPKPPHFAAKAQRVIHLFLNGGVSHVDTFDPKPILDEYHGRPLPNSQRTERKTGAAFRSARTEA